MTDEGAELLKAVKQMKAGKKGRVYTPEQLLAISARQSVNLTQKEFARLLNVSVIENETSKPVTADVTVKTVNLTGQLKNVTMRMIQEQDPDLGYPSHDTCGGAELLWMPSTSHGSTSR